MKMHKRFSITILVVMLLALAFPGSALAQPLEAPLRDQVIFGQNYTLKSGDTLNGSLLAFGGEITIEEGALVDGDVIGFGTEMNIDGEVDGSVIVIGSSISLDSTAVVQGDLIAPGTALYRSSDAIINGDVITETGPFNIAIPDVRFFRIQPSLPTPQLYQIGERVMTSFIWAFIFTALATVAIALSTERVEKISKAVVAQPISTGGLGLAVLIVFPFLMLLLTLFSFFLLTPLTILALVALAFAVAFGWIAIGFELGKRISKAFKQDWMPAMEVAVGAFILTLVLGLFRATPCIGWISWPVGMIVASIGLGAVLMTRLGTREYMVAPAAVAAPPSVEITEDTPEE
jgi:hypothetical protein